MDVNGTRHHLLLTDRDWLGDPGETGGSRVNGTGPPESRNLTWHPVAQHLTLDRQSFRFPPRSSEQAPDVDRRRAAARDRYGNIYWIDEVGRQVRVLWSAESEPSVFWSLADAAAGQQPCPTTGAFGPTAASPPIAPAGATLAGLAVTEHHYLVVGLREPGGVLIFDLHAGGPPILKPWPPGIDFAPFDMTPLPGGGVAILDRGDGARPPAVWELDNAFRVVTGVIENADDVQTEHEKSDRFRPTSGSPRRRRHHSFGDGFPLPMDNPPELRRPIAIEGLPDGSVLVMNRDAAQRHSTVYRYRRGTAVGAGLPLEVSLGSSSPPGPTDPLRGYDFLLVSPDERHGQIVGTLLVVDADGNQAFAFRLEADPQATSLEVLPELYPMRRYQGSALIAGDGAAWYESAGRWVPLVEQPRRQFVTDGQLQTRVLDGRVHDCVWHRLFVDACIPADAELIVESRTANDPESLEQSLWNLEPKPYRRGLGSELPHHQPFAGRTYSEGSGTWELLFQQATGRYLQLRLTLRGGGRNSPRLRALRVYYPRFSYSERFLPAIYREDPTSASFLERFLANVEGVNTTLEGRIANVQMLFDPRIVSADYLDWLASWLGLVLDPTWDPAKQRLFIAHAAQMFQQRGTVAGLLSSIELALDSHPDETLFKSRSIDCGRSADSARRRRYAVRIVERFLTRAMPGVVHGDPTDPVDLHATDPQAHWSPQDGVGRLHERFQTALQEEYGTIDALNIAWKRVPSSCFARFEQIPMPPTRPDHPIIRAAWTRFLDRLEFTYAPVDRQEHGTYREFLRARYRTIARLNQEHSRGEERALDSFDDVPWPDQLPEEPQELSDWIQFVSHVVPSLHSAHRMTVLVPLDAEADPETIQQRLDLVRRVVEIERPAHCSYDVLPFWDMFRVGEARLGLDSTIDQSGRFQAMSLGRGQLGATYLAAGHPANLDDRLIADRDRLGNLPRL